MPDPNLRYTDAYLDGLRLIADPEPDSLIDELAERHELDAVNRVLRHLVTNHRPVHEQLPDHLAAWLRLTGELPPGTDEARLERGSRFYMEHGVEIALLLSTVSLVLCYAARKGVRVLTFTHRLDQDPYRRVAESAQFVLSVATPGALLDGGHGIPVIQKVRLIHSAVRHLIRRSGRWPFEELGVPICQEDLLGTFLAFSYVSLRGLEKLGVAVRPQDAEDFLYLWRVVAEMMGVLPETLPGSYKETDACADAILHRHLGPSPEGVQMTRALLEMHAHVAQGVNGVPGMPGMYGQAFQGVVPALIRHVLGEEIAGWMEVPRTHWDAVFRLERPVGHVLDFLGHHTGGLGRLVERVGMKLITHEAFAHAGYRRAGFEIPSELRAHWDAKESGTVAAADARRASL